MKVLNAACLFTVAASLPLTAVSQQEMDGQSVETPMEPVIISDYQPPASEARIVIRPGKDEVFYEYRVNNEVLEIKVVPEVGPEYYLVPAEGGGWRRAGESDMLVPSWVLFRW